MTSRPVLLPLALLLLLPARQASADAGRIPIYQPTTIAQSGSYYLTRDVAGTIVITAQDVTLDLGGHTIQVQGGATAISGFWSSGEAPDVRVTNGEIRGDGSGVGIGMNLQRGSVVIDHLRIRRLSVGIYLLTDDATERRARAVVTDNTIADVAFGVDLLWYPGSVVERNVVRLLKPAFAPAIRAEGCGGVRIADNDITGGQDALYVGNSENAVIERNVVSKARATGITLVSSTGGRVSGNSVGSTEGDGISLVQTFSMALDGNVSSRNDSMGLRIDAGSSGIVYSGNRLLGNAAGNDFGAANYSTGGNSAGGPPF